MGGRLGVSGNASLRVKESWVSHKVCIHEYDHSSANAKVIRRRLVAVVSTALMGMSLLQVVISHLEEGYSLVCDFVDDSMLFCNPSRPASR